MAWHSGKPADTDLLSQSVQHIRENFAELEPLQPHIAAILDSRIVEMGSNSNGTYVRWENGLQICWRVWSQSGLTPATRNIQGFTRYYVDVFWTFPAAFVGQPAVAVGGDQNDPSYRNVWQITTTGAAFACNGWSSFSSLDLIIALAVGRWK